MTEFVAIIALVAIALAVVQWWLIWQTTRELRKRLAQVDSLVQGLTRRVWELENGSAPKAHPPPLTVVEPSPPAEPAPVTVQPARPRQDWETLVGTNWLNRLGALVLVIGIALFLGYSLTQLGPLGKIGIGLAIGASLLAAGVAFEKRPLYRTFSYSVMGAGWAVLYFSVYAMHGLPAARVIESPALGVLLLAAASAGMIAHALRYGSELATALAYLLGFVGLNVSSLTGFAVVATLMLAASLVVLAYRFQWFRLPLMGVVLTYLTFVLRYDASIYNTGLAQITLWLYWSAFEIFDLLRLRRGSRQPVLFALNVCGFVGASLLHEWNMKAADWSLFLGVSSIAYLASAFARARWTPRAGDDAPSGYEPAAIASAALMAGALIERFTDEAITVALLIEAEMVVLAAHALGSVWLARAGSVLFLLPFVRLLLVDAARGVTISAGGLTLRRWTPVGLLMSSVFVLNRILLPRAWYFAAGAAVVLLAVANTELPRLAVAPVVAIAGALMLRARLPDVRWSGAGALVFAFGRAAIVNTDDGDVPGTGIVVAALYSSHMLWKRTPVLSILGTCLLTLLVYEKLHGRMLTVSLGAEGAALLAAGFVLSDRSFRLSGLLLFVLCIAKLFVHDLRELDTVSRILSFVVLGVVLMAASWVYTRTGGGRFSARSAPPQTGPPPFQAGIEPESPESQRPPQPSP